MLFAYPAYLRRVITIASQPNPGSGCVNRWLYAIDLLHVPTLGSGRYPPFKTLCQSLCVQLGALDFGATNDAII